MAKTPASQDATTSESTQAAVAAWFSQRLPTDWTAVPARVTVDREEIIVILTVPAPESPAPESPVPESPAPEGQAAAVAAQARAGRIARFREETRDRRISVAREAEHRFGRKVSWGVESGGSQEVFTSLAIPVMTRLRQPERLVLDTLVDAGVARSRAHALAWCVRLVGDNTATWLGDLRTAMAAVEKVREAGPSSGSS